MQGTLRVAMDALKKGDNKEVERLLLVVGSLLEKLIRGEQMKNILCALAAAQLAITEAHVDRK
jgi:hypothetical protein